MTNIDSETDRVKGVLSGLGATITRVSDSDGVDFELDGMSGFARQRRGKFRASFFIAIDPEPHEANRFVADHDDVPYGDVQLIETADGSAIRLLVELPYEAGEQIRTTEHTARALHAGWMNRHAQGADLLTTLSAAGIAVPPRPAHATIHTYGPWSWGSRYVPPFAMYMFEVEFIARQLIEHGEFFAMSHAGHGINSYGLNLVTARKRVAAFVQHGYGGAYMDPVTALTAINATYSRLHVLMRALDEEPAAEPRWLATQSSFRGCTGVIDLHMMRQGVPLQDAAIWVHSESELFEQVATRLELQNIDFGAVAGLSW